MQNETAKPQITEPRVLVIDDSPTILKVVQLVLSKAGFVVDIASNGKAGLDLARTTIPQLILLDFVMPKMNGYQVCKALLADETLASIPVVLMSAKGDQVGERFVKVMGIVDYITKPFSPEAITAVVQHTIAKYGGINVTPPPFDDGEFQPQRHLADASPMVAPTSVGASADRTVQLLDKLRHALANNIEQAIAQRSPEDVQEPSGQKSAAQTKPANVAANVAEALSDELLLEVFRGLKPNTNANANANVSLQGDVRVFPIAEVLQLLDAQQQSGTLHVTSDGANIDVCFRDGRIELAIASNLTPEYLIGRYMIDAKLISEFDLQGYLESPHKDATLLGRQLIQLGHLSESELKVALQQQTRDLIYELLCWSFGEFRFECSDELPAAASDAMLGLEVEGILMEGFRRVEEWHLIEREVSDFDMIFLRNEDAVSQMGRGRLTREELTVLELVNGKNSIKAIIRESKMGSYEVSKMLYRLLSIKLIRKRVAPVAV